VCPPRRTTRRDTSGRSIRATTSSAPRPTARASSASPTRQGTTPRGPSAVRTARSSSRPCATATSISIAWTRTARSPASHGHARLRRRRLLQRRLHEDRLAAARPKGKDLESSRAAGPGPRPTDEARALRGQRRRSEARQITYLDAASFAPYWHPSQKRILFSSNWASSSPREFDMWGIDVDGTRLERVTTAPGFDGSRCSRRTENGSRSRRTAPPRGQHDTNLFLARWSRARLASRRRRRIARCGTTRALRSGARRARRGDARAGRSRSLRRADAEGGGARSGRNGRLPPPFEATTKVTGPRR